MSLNQFETDEQRAEALVDWLKANGAWIFWRLWLSLEASLVGIIIKAIKVIDCQPKPRIITSLSSL